MIRPAGIESAGLPGSKLPIGGARDEPRSGRAFDTIDPEGAPAAGETIGPAVVRGLDTGNEAPAPANRPETGLVAGLCASDISRAPRMSRRIVFGPVQVSGWVIGRLAAPTGGENTSRIRRERAQQGTSDRRGSRTSESASDGPNT